MKGHQAHAIWLSGIMNAEELRNFSLFEVPFSSPAAIDKSDYIDGIKSFKNELQNDLIFASKSDLENASILHLKIDFCHEIECSIMVRQGSEV